MLLGEVERGGHVGSFSLYNMREWRCRLRPCCISLDGYKEATGHAMLLFSACVYVYLVAVEVLGP